MILPHASSVISENKKYAGPSFSRDNEQRESCFFWLSKTSPFWNIPTPHKKFILKDKLKYEGMKVFEIFLRYN